MSIANVLLEIITNTPGGITIHCPNVNELCRDIYEDTGIMITPKRQLDHYESQKLDYHGDPYISQRINTRKHLLNFNIKTMEIKGKIHEIGVTQQVSDTFKKRDLIIEYAENPTYPEYIKFEMLQDKTSLADNLKVGQEIEVAYNLRGRPWTDKQGKVSYFNSLVIWRVTAVTGSKGGEAYTPPAYTPPAAYDASGNDDDLPF